MSSRPLSDPFIHEISTRCGSRAGGLEPAQSQCKPDLLTRFILQSSPTHRFEHVPTAGACVSTEWQARCAAAGVLQPWCFGACVDLMALAPSHDPKGLHCAVMHREAGHPAADPRHASIKGRQCDLAALFSAAPRQREAEERLSKGAATRAEGQVHYGCASRRAL